jgi:selenocysteine-specific elongation factor
MKSVIVGTAGHIDHGKTALVRALTGIDADRLEEEKRRGITIDLGFAHLELPAPDDSRLRLGFVDVPGHERFVRNMLAGVGGIDLVLLVIAADESIKPQTREHFDICRLLDIRRGITVLTKSDLVDADTLAVVRLEVEDFLRGSFLEGAPIVPVSSLSGAGLDELRRTLAAAAAGVTARDTGAALRLPIDRVFTMKGFGTVVTGTLISGAVRKEDELEAFPSTQRLRVRGIQVHGAAADEATAGQRTALNLAGVTTEELQRGMMLASPGRFRATCRVEVELTLLTGAPALRDRARVHLHCYTAEAIAEVVLPSGGEPGTADSSMPSATATPRHRQLRPGQTAWAQLRLAEPLLLLPGDRFILRQFSPVITIGGGVVVDAAPLARKAVADPELLAALRTASAKEAVRLRIARRVATGISLADLVAETGLLRPQVEKIVLALAGAGAIRRCGEMAMDTHGFAAAQGRALETVSAFHQANPLVAGISKQELLTRLELDAELFAGVLESLAGRLEVAGETVRVAGRGVVMKDEEAASKRQIEAAFATAGLKVPALKEVLAGLKVDRARAQKIVTLLLRDRVLIKVSEELVFHQTALETLRQLIAEYKAKSPRIDVTRFKELTGVSRKYAIPLLEYLDRERVTRRVGDERVIL